MRRVSNGRSAELVGVAQPIVRCGEGRCECPRRQIAERRMWTVVVVVDDPAGQRRPGMVEVAEQCLVEEFVPHSPIEGLADAVLHLTTRRDVVQLDSGLLRPEQDGVRDELGPIVADDELRLAAPGDERRQFASTPPARDRRVGDRGEALLRRVVDDVEHPEPLPGRHLVVDEPKAGEANSSDQRALGRASTTIGTRAPMARLRQRRRRTDSPSSR